MYSQSIYIKELGLRGFSSTNNVEAIIKGIPLIKSFNPGNLQKDLLKLYNKFKANV